MSYELMRRVVFGLLVSCSIYFNSHVSWYPCQLKPIMFCQFNKGLMTIPQ